MELELDWAEIDMSNQIDNSWHKDSVLAIKKKEFSYVKNCFFRKLPTSVREREKTILEHAQEPRTRPPLQWWVLDVI